jgi:16S rRNA (cytosine967-C5)-methyltransferase
MEQNTSFLLRSEVELLDRGGENSYLTRVCCIFTNEAHRNLLKEAWSLAIESLSWIELQRLGERLAINKASRQLEIKDPKTVGLAHKMIFETLRRLNVIDSTLNWFLAPRSLNDFKLGIQAFLRIYTYQVVFEKADYKDTVAIAQMGREILGWHQLTPVEEVFGKILNAKLADTLQRAADEERVALQTYNPRWFVKYCFKTLGRTEALDFLSSLSEPLPTYIRLNTLREPEENCLKKLGKEGIALQKEPLLKFTYKLLKTQKPLIRTESFRQGLFYVQDKASCLAVEVAKPDASDVVLDVCGAPGAKTTHIAQLMQNQGAIYSIDYSRRRIGIWKREIKRMGVTNATAIVADAQRTLPINVAADLVLLDPPCTSTGAFGKTPSAKWRLTKNSIYNMAAIQWNMLNNCVENVRKDGDIVYSTCSVSLEENEMLIEKFLKWHTDFRLVETVPRLGLPGFRNLEECQRLYPHLHKCNGFFVAKLTREND